MGTKLDTLDNARLGLLREFNLVLQEGITNDELDRAKNFLIGNYLIDHESNSSQAFYLGWFEIIGAGWQFDSKYPKLIQKVALHDVLDVAQRYLAQPTTVILKPQENAD
jgi:predicted Zn-dependent peptidase